MEKSESIKSIAVALIKAQAEFEKAKKAAFNPHLKSNYEKLDDVIDAVLPILNKYEIAALQPIVLFEGFGFVETVLIHSSGEWIGGSMTPVINPKANDAQSQGAGITYARKFGLKAMLSIGTEDDKDGQELKAAAGEAKTKPDNKVIVEKTQEDKDLEMVMAAKSIEELTALKNGGIPADRWTKKIVTAATHHASSLKAAKPKEEPKAEEKGTVAPAVEKKAEEAKKTLPKGVEKSHATEIGHGVKKNELVTDIVAEPVVTTPPAEEGEDDLAGL